MARQNDSVIIDKMKIPVKYIISTCLLLLTVKNLYAYSLRLGRYDINTITQLLIMEGYNDNILLSDIEDNMEGGFTSKLSSNIGFLVHDNKQRLYFLNRFSFTHLPTTPNNISRFYTDSLELNAERVFLNEKLHISIADTFSWEPLSDNIFVAHDNLVGATQLEISDIRNRIAEVNPATESDLENLLEGLLKEKKRPTQNNDDLMGINRFRANISLTNDISKKTVSLFEYNFSKTSAKDSTFSDTANYNTSLSLNNSIYRAWKIGLSYNYDIQITEPGILMTNTDISYGNLQLGEQNRLLNDDVVQRNHLRNIKLSGKFTKNWKLALSYNQKVNNTEGKILRQKALLLRQTWEVTPFVDITGATGYTFISSEENVRTETLICNWQFSRKLKLDLQGMKNVRISRLGTLFVSENIRFSHTYLDRFYKSDANYFLTRQKLISSGNIEFLRGGEINLLFNVPHYILEASNVMLSASVSQSVNEEQNIRTTDINNNTAFIKTITGWLSCSVSVRHRLFKYDTLTGLRKVRNLIYLLTLEGSI